MTSLNNANDYNTLSERFTPAKTMYSNTIDRSSLSHFNTFYNHPHLHCAYSSHNSNGLSKNLYRNNENKFDDNIGISLHTLSGITTSAGHFRTVRPKVETALKIKQNYHT